MDNNQQNDNRPNGPGGAGQGPNRNRSAFMVFLAITVAVLLGMALFNGLMGSSGSEEISGMAGQWLYQERDRERLQP